MKFKDYLTEKKVKLAATPSDIKLVKQVANDFGITLTDAQAKKAHKIVAKRSTEEEYYYNLKEYFLN